RYEVVVAFGGAGPLADRLARAGVRTTSITSLERDVSIGGDLKSLFALLSVIKKERPDIIHVNSSKIGGIGAFAARIMGVKRIVFTCHGWPFNEERGFFSTRLIRFLSWLTVIFSHATIAVSERDLFDGQKMVGVRSKLRLVHNGVREPALKTRADAAAFIRSLAAKKGVIIDERDFIVGAIGELHKNKGYEYLLAALAELKSDTKLVVFGEGEEHEGLEAMAAALGINNRVAFAGFVPEAAAYLAGFDVIVLSSIKEGLPYVVIEAGFAGLPVVATNVGGVKEIVEDMRSGILVQTRKPDDIAQALDMLKQEPEKAASFGRALRESTIAEFSLPRMVEGTIVVYEGR
ncbi:MAG: glycosyltransferase, partial [Patescibacteria group bacterium]|nr:glycosyltransferase [Patescibacteria group bacterium]